MTKLIRSLPTKDRNTLCLTDIFPKFISLVRSYVYKTQSSTLDTEAATVANTTDPCEKLISMSHTKSLIVQNFMKILRYVCIAIFMKSIIMFVKN